MAVANVASWDWSSADPLIMVFDRVSITLVRYGPSLGASSTNGSARRISKVIPPGALVIKELQATTPERRAREACLLCIPIRRNVRCD